MLSPKSIEDFQRRYFKETGKTLSPEQAVVMGENLIFLYKALLRPLPNEQEGTQNEQ